MAGKKNKEETPRNTLKRSTEPEPVKDLPKEKKKEKAPREKKFTGPSRIMEFLRDERTRKVTGLALLVFSLFLLAAFISYFFSWKADQSVAQGGPADMSAPPRNMMGLMGARLAHFFIHNWFGIASFLLIPLFFLYGVKLLYQRTLVKLNRAIGILGFLTIWSSGVLAFALPQVEGGILGGKFGARLSDLLGMYTGPLGTGLVYLFTFLVFMVIAFNAALRLPAFNFLRKRSKPVEEETGELNLDEEDQPLVNVYTHRNAIHPEKEEAPEPPEEEEEDLDIDISEVPDFEVRELEPEPETELEPELEPEPEKQPEPVIMKQPEPELELDLGKGPELEVEQPQPETGEEISMADQLVKQYGEYDPTLDLPRFDLPGLGLLVDYGESEIKINKEELEENKNRIVETLRNYNIDIAKIKATVGPTVTLYEIVPAAGVRISKIKNLEDDIALSLAALGIRIIAPIPGKGTIGIEVPNQNPEVVSMHSILKHEKFVNSKFDLPVALGKTISNEVFITDLAKMPHLLMAGATGQGKSVGLNAILVSLLYKKHPSQIKFVMVDPKKVELTLYNRIEKHYLAKLPNEEEPIITDTKKVINTLNSLCIEMDTRYELLKNAQVRNIKEYNAKFTSRKLNPADGHHYLPYIVLVIDEFADLIMTAGKEVEMPIARLAQLARAIGIHLIIATQRPSVNIITGTIKANFPARIAFRVTSKIDSRTILDTGGADQLIGRGDMLLSTGNDLIRLQCPFVDTPEVEKITEFIGKQSGYGSAFQLPEYYGEEGDLAKDKMDISEMDELFEEAARIVVQHQQGSASLLQRRLNLGYNRAGRLIDQMEAIGIVGPNQGSKARQVLIADEMALEQFLKELR